MKRRGILSLVMALVLVVGSAFGTYAWFTGYTKTANNRIETGEIEMAITSNPQNETRVFTISGDRQPGDTVANAKFVIENVGDFSAVYFDNLAIMGGNTELADKIYIKKATAYITDKNDVVNDATYTTKDGKIINVWPDKYFEDGKPLYAFVDENKDGKISLTEWLADANQSISIGNGWHYSALKPGFKFVQEIELAFDTTANNYYSNKYIDIAYQVHSTQYTKEAAQELITNVIKPGSGALDWGFVEGQHNMQ